MWVMDIYIVTQVANANLYKIIHYYRVDQLNCIYENFARLVCKKTRSVSSVLIILDRNNKRLILPQKIVKCYIL